MSLEEYQNFREYLQMSLVARCQSNPKYSLRSFAKSLNIDSSTLSKILKEKRSITPKMLEHLSERLGLAPDEIELFRTEQKKRKIQGGTKKFKNIEVDRFRMISDWYHYAILELLNLDSFRSDSRWIAKVLNVSVSEINIAIERLIRLDMVYKDKKGNLKSNGINHTTIGTPYSASAFRNLQKQILSKAVSACDEIPYEKRDQSSLTVAIDLKSLPAFKSLIKDFRRQLNEMAQDCEKFSDVYHLSISFYPVTDPSGGQNA